MAKELFETGLQVRREVLGAEYVDAAVSQADDFSRPFQELVTEYCWGDLVQTGPQPQDPQPDQPARRRNSRDGRLRD